MRVRRRRQNPYRPVQTSARLYVRLESRHVALLKFLLEAEDNLAVPTVVDRFAAVVRLLYSPEAADRVATFVRDFGTACPEATVYYRPATQFPVAIGPGDA